MTHPKLGECALLAWWLHYFFGSLGGFILKYFQKILGSSCNSFLVHSPPSQNSSIHLVMFLFCIASHFNRSSQQLLCPHAPTSFPVLLISLMGISIKMGNWDLGVSWRINALHLKARGSNRAVCSLSRSHLFLHFLFFLFFGLNWFTFL